MGYTYEVRSWVAIDGQYMYVEVYRGESFDEAMTAMRKEKERGVGCVKFEWR